MTEVLDFAPEGLSEEVKHALACVANCRATSADAPTGHGPDEVVGRVQVSALAWMGRPGADAATLARAHLYLLGKYGRFDVIDDLAVPALAAGVPSQWAAGIRTWLATPTWARPAPLT